MAGPEAGHVRAGIYGVQAAGAARIAGTAIAVPAGGRRVAAVYGRDREGPVSSWARRSLEPSAQVRAATGTAVVARPGRQRGSAAGAGIMPG